MRETTLMPVDQDKEILQGMVVLNTEKELLPAIKKQVNFKETLMNLLEIPVDKAKLYEMLAETVDLDKLPEEPTLGDYLTGALIEQAAMGNVKAYETIRDTMGQAPVQQVQQDTTLHIVLPDSIKEYGE